VHTPHLKLSSNQQSASSKQIKPISVELFELLFFKHCPKKSKDEGSLQFKQRHPFPSASGGDFGRLVTRRARFEEKTIDDPAIAVCG
jgi:hypothetical protein